MDHATARGLMIGGAVLAAVSLLMPWYTLTADQLPQGLGTQSGWTSLGSERYLVLGLAAVAVLAVVAAWQPLLAGGAGLGLLAIALLRWSEPPDASLGQLPGTGNPLGDALVTSFAESLVDEVGLRLDPTIGLVAIGAGAGCALVGAARAPARA